MSGEQRFWTKVDKSGECWTWTAARNRDGYGIFHDRGRTFRAHRWIYELLNGAVPARLVLDHTCRNRACVNPKHLEAVTNMENLRRGEGPSSRTACPRGHAYTLKGDGTRYCRVCHRATQRASKARLSAKEATA